MNTTADRQKVEKDAVFAVSKARVRLITSPDRPQDCFFAVLALRFTPVPDWSVPTAATDGKCLWYNPQWWLNLTEKERIGVLVHEVLHCALGHQARRGSRDPKAWNIAGDLAINALVERDGFALPEGRLLPGRAPFADFPPEASAEEYYDLLKKGGSGGGDSPNGQPADDPGGCGAVRDASPSQAEQSASQADWKAAVSQAATVAKQRGQLPAGLEKLVGDLLAPKVLWSDVLREFVRAHARNDYSWVHPNRRYANQGIFLPGMHSEELGEIVVAIDTSGSCFDDDTQQRFASEMQGILEAYDCTAHVIYCDSAVHEVETWTRTDGEFKLHASGGGGTSHRPVFEKITELGLDPVCVVCLTDLYTDFPPDRPPYPVLWAAVNNPQATPPFGQVCYVK